MPKSEIFVFVCAERLFWVGAGGGERGWEGGVLGCSAVGGGWDEEGGGGFFFFFFFFFWRLMDWAFLVVFGDECGRGVDSAVGCDGGLVWEDWVCVLECNALGTL
jgi:hypothetical protein